MGDICPFFRSTQSTDSASLYWNFPSPRARRYHTQLSSPGPDGSNLSTDSVDGMESEEVLAPYSPHRKNAAQPNFRPINYQVEDNINDSSDKISLFSKQTLHLNGEAVRRPKPRSIESSGPESRFSVSDSGINITQEEEFLLGSVKPRGGRRKRNLLKQAASETLNYACSSFELLDQPLTTRRNDANFLETTL